MINGDTNTRQNVNTTNGLGGCFVVRTGPNFENKFRLLIQNNKGDILHSELEPNNNFANMNLLQGANRLQKNAGGSSEVSEVLSFVFQHSMWGAELLKTETEVKYRFQNGPMTDYVCTIFEKKIAVSVTRAMKYGGGAYHEKDAIRLLRNKLNGVNKSSKNSLEGWEQQILHVWSQRPDITNTLTNVYSTLPKEMVSNTVLLVTTTPNSNFIYENNFSSNCITQE